MVHAPHANIVLPIIQIFRDTFAHLTATDYSALVMSFKANDQQTSPLDPISVTKRIRF
jgi:hypothetical protein